MTKNCAFIIASQFAFRSISYKCTDLIQAL